MCSFLLNSEKNKLLDQVKCLIHNINSLVFKSTQLGNIIFDLIFMEGSTHEGKLLRAGKPSRGFCCVRSVSAPGSMAAPLPDASIHSLSGNSPGLWAVSLGFMSMYSLCPSRRLI